VERRHLERTVPSGAAIFTIRFSPDGRTIATGGISGTVDFWNAADGRKAASPLGGQNGAVISVSYDPTGHELMTTSSDGGLRLWDLRSRKLVGRPLPGSDVGGWGTIFPDGGHAIAVFGDGTGIVWSASPLALSRKRSGATSWASADTARPAHERARLHRPPGADRRRQRSRPRRGWKRGQSRKRYVRPSRVAKRPRPAFGAKKPRVSAGLVVSAR
jgi:WD40 repeat protein